MRSSVGRFASSEFSNPPVALPAVPPPRPIVGAAELQIATEYFAHGGGNAEEVPIIATDQRAHAQLGQPRQQIRAHLFEAVTGVEPDEIERLVGKGIGREVTLGLM